MTKFEQKHVLKKELESMLFKWIKAWTPWEMLTYIKYKVGPTIPS